MWDVSVKHGDELLHELLQADGPVSLSVLQDHLHLSRRSIYYTIKQVNQLLVQHELDEIDNIRGVGYQLSSDCRASLEKALVPQHRARSFTRLFYDNYRFQKLSQSDRQELLIFCLVSRETSSLNELAGFFSVSKNTVIADLNMIANRLSPSLTIQNTSTGKTMVGDERLMRRWVFANFDHLMDLISPLIAFAPNPHYTQQLKLLERITGNAFTDHSMQLLTNYIQWTIERLRRRPDCALKLGAAGTQSTGLTATWALSFFRDLGLDNPAEARFIAGVVNTQAFQHIDENNPMAKQLAKVASQVIRRFNDFASVGLPTENGPLVHNLTIHLVSTYYRLHYQIAYTNPLLDKIKTGYQETFELTKAAVRPFEQFADQKLSDDEVALITVYFSGALRASTVSHKSRPGVLVVCSSGIGTSELLITQLRHHYPSVNFIGPYNTFQYENISLDHVRLVFSTVDLPEVENRHVVTVPVIPGPADWPQIDQQLVTAGLIQMSNQSKINVTTIMDIISNYARIEEPQKLEKALHDYINREPASQHEFMHAKHQSAVRYCNQAVSWQEAIKFAIAPLIQQGTVEPEYCQHIIRLTRQHGDYMAIGRGVFLAHAAPSAGVNELGFSYSYFTQPFKVSDDSDKQINFIVSIAPVDQEQHLSVLSHLLQCLQNPQWMEALHKVKSENDLEKVLVAGQLLEDK